jgi:hypothetical protein
MRDARMLLPCLTRGVQVGHHQQRRDGDGLSPHPRQQRRPQDRPARALRRRTCSRCRARVRRPSSLSHALARAAGHALALPRRSRRAAIAACDACACRAGGADRAKLPRPVPRTRGVAHGLQASAVGSDGAMPVGLCVSIVAHAKMLPVGRRMVPRAQGAAEGIGCRTRGRGWGCMREATG